MKQKNKYRYFYSVLSRQLRRFESLTSNGDWYSEEDGKFSNSQNGGHQCYNTLTEVLAFAEKYPKYGFEVTLSQGLHYMKGNYVE